MPDLSIIIPTRRERFLQETIDDIMLKAEGDIEVIVVLDGYWPDPQLKNYKNLVLVHVGTVERNKGMRYCINAGVAVAKGKYIMKVDAHCLFDKGFDVKLIVDCKSDWIVIPRRYSLDPEKWCRKDKRPIDYIYVQCPNDDNPGDLAGKVWKRPELEDKLIDDLMAFQGSCWFIEKEYFYKLDGLDDEKYGTFRKEPQELGFKCWLSGGRVVRNKKTWYAHLYKGRQYGRGYFACKKDHLKGDEYNKKWLTNSAWDKKKQTKDFKWLIDKFNPPGWENYSWGEKSEMVSIIIPSRNEQFLQKTIDDILAKAEGEIEVIAVLDGYQPDPSLKKDSRVRIVHHDKPKGLRLAVNAGVAVAKGKYIMKTDAHCLFDKGFDVKLAADCEKNWVAVPTRKRLDAEKWEVKDVGKPDIDYLYLSFVDSKSNWGVDGPGFAGIKWRQKNHDKALRKDLIVDCMTFQGSCWFMHKTYFYELELLDHGNYGYFGMEAQEIGFKAWLSGGRVIRNKKTWYAHLHKGHRYGRGYVIGKGTLVKPTQFANKWIIGEAWHKQTLDLKWLIDKFAPVPEWESCDWEKLREKWRKGKLYQNIKIDGQDLGRNPKKKYSKFWNEGKWDTFINPLLPEDCADMTFVEVGCNAGLFLKMAEKKGFRDVVGFDKSRSTIKEGVRYRDSLGLKYKILYRTVDHNFNFDEIPVADVTVLSTVHYYFTLNDWLKYLDQLQYKTQYCLIVSRHLKKTNHWVPSTEFSDIRLYFKDWKEIGAICDISSKRDPYPRDEELYSLMFESRLKRRKIDDIYIKNVRLGRSTQCAKRMIIPLKKLAKEVAQNDTINVLNTEFYKEHIDRRDKKRHKNARKFVQEKIDVMYDVKHNGLKEPLLVQLSGQISDGGHRLAILKEMGYKSVMTRII